MWCCEIHLSNFKTYFEMAQKYHVIIDLDWEITGYKTKAIQIHAAILEDNTCMVVYRLHFIAP